LVGVGEVTTASRADGGPGPEGHHLDTERR
jgi:hypothetical protein